MRWRCAHAHAHSQSKARRGITIAGQPEDRNYPASPVAHHGLSRLAPRLRVGTRSRRDSDTADHTAEVLRCAIWDMAEKTPNMCSASRYRSDCHGDNEATEAHMYHLSEKRGRLAEVLHASRPHHICRWKGQRGPCSDSVYECRELRGSSAGVSRRDPMPRMANVKN
jgi:hypothetical protein